MADYRERYKPMYLGDGNYSVIEEHSKEITDSGPYTYPEAQAVADRYNALKAERVRKDLEQA